MYLYTKRGIYHKNNEENSGDVVCGVDDGVVAVLALADGVSSCSYGAEGAKKISSIAIEYVHDQYLRLGFLPRDWAKIMIGNIHKEIQNIAISNGNSYDEYSSTLIVVAIDRIKGTMNYCNIGDGLIMTIGKKKCPIVCMPQGNRNGCPVFTTKGIENAVKTGVIKLTEAESVLICSDGTWNIMYRQNIMRPEIKEDLVKKNFDGFMEFIESADSLDDCSFAILDVRSVA